MRVALVALVVAVGCSSGNAPRVVTPVPQVPVQAQHRDGLPLDPRVKTGRLPNGLTYYVLGVDAMYDYTQTWASLVVAAGADDETQAQRGATEQLAQAFWRIQYSSENPQQRARVAFDHTVVSAVPKDLAHSMTELRRIADGVEWDADTFNDPQEEWEEEFREAKRPRGPNEGPYRPRTREEESAGPFDAKTYGGVKSFYETWYRPDRMTVVAVSDDKPDNVIAEIKRAFGSMKNPSAPAPQRTVGPPRTGAPGLVVTMHTDESAGSRFELRQRVPRRRARSERDYRAYVASQAARDILGARLSTVHEGEWGTLDETPIDISQDELTFSFYEMRSVDDYVTAMRELERMRVHGVEGNELAIWQDRIARRISGVEDTSDRPHDGYEPDRGNGFGSYVIGDAAQTNDHPYLLHRLVEDARGETVFPGAAYDLTVVQSLTREEVSAAAATLLTSSSRTINAAGEPSDKDRLVTADIALRATPPPRWADAPHVRPLVSPTAGTVTAERVVDGLGIFELGNGARAIVRPISSAQETVIYAIGPGGWGHLDADAAFEHWVAPVVVLENGLGNMTRQMFLEALLGRTVEITGNVWRNSHQLAARGAPERLETLAQVMHLALAKPRKDSRGVATLQGDATIFDGAAMQMVEIERALDALENKSPRPATTRALLDKLDSDRVFQIYADELGNMKSTTFVIVGDVDVATVKPLIATYLASIPSSGTRITAKPRKPAKVKTPTTILGNPTTTIVEYLGPRETKNLDELELSLTELSVIINQRMRGRGEVLGGLTPENRRKVRVTVSSEPPVTAAEIQKLIEGIAAEPNNIGDQLEREMRTPERFVDALESAIIRGDDPAATAIFYQRRYANGISDAGLKAVAAALEKPTAVVKGVK